MGKNRVDVIIHIGETLDHSKLQGIADGVKQVTGVESASFRDEQPHIMVVYYDPDLANSQAIYKAVTGQGVHAELMGL